MDLADKEDFLKLGRDIRIDGDHRPAEKVLLKEAVIQAEDRRVYEHGGVEYRSIGGALIRVLTSESLDRPSTITMQLASLLDKGLQSKKGREILKDAIVLPSDHFK